MNQNKAYNLGHDAFAQAMPQANMCTLGMSNDDKRLFWTGFLAASFGCTIKDMGPQLFGEVLNDVITATETMVEQAIEESQVEANAPH